MGTAEPISLGMSNISLQDGMFVLKNKLEYIKDEQGFLGNIWNGFKEVTTFGKSVSDCEKMLDKYNSGEISFEEAAEYIEDFKRKQDNATDLVANIGTGVAAIAATAGTAGIAPLLGIGAGVGAAVKTGIKFLDKATNKIENDEYDAKSNIKNMVSGAMAGATSAIPSSIFKNAHSASVGKRLLFENGAKCGLACGSASGFVGYMTDVALGDKEFDLKECVKTTALSGAFAAPVGGLVTAGASSISGSLSQVQQDMAASSAKKIGNYLERNIVGAA